MAADLTVQLSGSPVQVYLGDSATLAALFAQAAAASAAFAEAISGPTYASQALGEAATTTGQYFAVAGSGIVTIYLRTSGGSTAQRTLATTVALASTAAGQGAALVGVEGGGTVQDELEDLDADLTAGLALKLDVSTHTATGGDTAGMNYGGTGSVTRTVAAVINDYGINVMGYGAVGGDTAGVANLVAFKAALAKALTTGAPLFIPPGVFRLDMGAVEWLLDPTRIVQGARRAIKIHGSGQGQTFINVTNPGSTGIRVASTTDWYGLSLENFTVMGSQNSPLFILGKDDYSDPLNELSLKSFAVENGFNGSSNVACRFNYVVQIAAHQFKCNAYASGTGTNTGTALELRQAEFGDFSGGSFGNGNYGVHAKDGISHSLRFGGQTFENSNVCFRNSGSSNFGFMLDGPQLTEVVTYGIQSTTGSTSQTVITLRGHNFASRSGGSAVLLDPSNQVGVSIQDRAGITTPSVAASGVDMTNATGRRVFAMFWGGTVTSFSHNGFGIGKSSLDIILEPGDTISWTGSSAPSMIWRNASW